MHTHARTHARARKLDSNKFCNLLTKVNWRNIIENDTIDISATNFTDTFVEIAEQCMPAKTIFVRQRDAVWINDEIRILIEKRKEIHKKAKQSNREADWRKFRQFRNYVILKFMIFVASRCRLSSIFECQCSYPRRYQHNEKVGG